MNQQNIDYVLRSVEQRDIRFVRLWFVDILGRLKNFAISLTTTPGTMCSLAA